MSRNETTRRIGHKNGSHSVSDDPLTAIIAQTLTHEVPSTTCPETDIAAWEIRACSPIETLQNRLIACQMNDFTFGRSAYLHPTLHRSRLATTPVTRHRRWLTAHLRQSRDATRSCNLKTKHWPAWDPR